ncbi:hypothetical protein MA16_Dca000608 [Dendrobium catenatum]|uniref:Uncharacterized protein n=1 Tax=Dendrobium catenatum TaxID=906689 RepID=A0A2I0WUE6_9ASPA|nr:hypothetical protein MA16_Dca000608 [Dendrobium catenatum]
MEFRWNTVAIFIVYESLLLMVYPTEISAKGGISIFVRLGGKKWDQHLYELGDERRDDNSVGLWR